MWTHMQLSMYNILLVDPLTISLHYCSTQITKPNLKYSNLEMFLYWSFLFIFLDIKPKYLQLLVFL